jgi:hypothetical protein
MVCQEVQKLRTKRPGEEISSQTLFEVADCFRYQSATFGPDKVYGLMGLLPAKNPTLLKADYTRPPEAVFKQVTASAIQHGKDLSAIAQASGVELRGATWCRDWCSADFQLCTHFENPDWVPAPERSFSPSGEQAPTYTVDYERGILGLKGCCADSQIRTGNFDLIRPDEKPSLNFTVVMLDWESVANINDSETKRAFNRTITAGRWTGSLMDWRERLGDWDSTENEACLMLVYHSGENRRFFVTKSGKFGMGPWNMKKNDIVAVLFGGKMPFVLRRCAAPRGNRKLPDDEPREYYKVIGEAYVDGLMYYEGSMEDDIASGKVVPQWFHLL